MSVKTVKRPAALHYITGQIASLDEQRDFLVRRMHEDAADIDAIDELRAELDSLREQC